MEPFREIEEVTTTSKVVGILPGEPPRLNLVDYASGQDGTMRHMAQQVPVLDAGLFAKLKTEVQIGDHIRATTVNEFTETGSRVYLSGFQKISSTTPVNGTQNGIQNLSDFPLTTSTLEPLLKQKQKIRH